MESSEQINHKKPSSQLNTSLKVMEMSMNNPGIAMNSPEKSTTIKFLADSLENTPSSKIYEASPSITVEAAGNHRMMEAGESLLPPAYNLPPKSSRPSSNMSSTLVLVEGMKVKIIGTENVLQRVPHLVNTIGIIKEAPVHPATWFKVEFPDQKVVTFRPSALQPLDDNGQPLASYVVKPSISKKDKSPALTGMKHSVKERCETIARSSGTTSGNGNDYYHSASIPKSYHHNNNNNYNGGSSDKKILLNSTDPDTWIGRKVAIVGGRFSGQPAFVKSSGNGWVQIDTPLGEVAKRAYELEVLGDNSGYSNNGGGDDGSYDSYRLFSSTNNKRRRNYGSSNNNNNNNNLDPFNANYRRGRAHYRYDVDNDDDDDDDGLDFISYYDYATKRQRFVDIEARRLLELEQERKKLPLIVNSNYLSLKRMNLIKSINKQRQELNTNIYSFNRNRPNLNEWKNKINASLFGMDSKANSFSIYPIQPTRLFDDNYCEVCCLEKWCTDTDNSTLGNSTSSKYCWNEFCPISPLYYKITGMMAKPTLTEAPSLLHISPSTSKMVIPAHGKDVGMMEDETDHSGDEDHGVANKENAQPIPSSTSLLEKQHSSLVSVSGNAMIAEGHHGLHRQTPDLHHHSENLEEGELDEEDSFAPLPPPLSATAREAEHKSFDFKQDSMEDEEDRHMKFPQILQRHAHYNRDRSESMACATDTEDQSPSYLPVNGRHTHVH